MSYVLGTHSSSDLGKSDPLGDVLATFSSMLAPVARDALARNFARYQAYNLFRFNVSDIKSTSDARLTPLMARDANGEFKNATTAFKAYYKACRVAAGVMNFTTKPTNNQVNTVAYDGWKAVWSQIVPAASTDTSVDTQGAGTEDNTLLYVAGAAGVALLAFGLMRRNR
jgi:hypothetical protein